MISNSGMIMVLNQTLCNPCIHYCVLADSFDQKLSEASDDPPPRSLLNSTSFAAVTRQNIPFEEYPFSWKWYWACGKRYIIVGLGVSCCNTASSALLLILLITGLRIIVVTIYHQGLITTRDNHGYYIIYLMFYSAAVFT